MVSALSSLGASQGYAQTALNPINQAAEKLNTQNTSPTGFQEAAQNFGQIFDKADMAVTELSKGEGSAQAVVEAMAQAEMALQEELRPPHDEKDHRRGLGRGQNAVEKTRPGQ
ncbi:MAG: hypothetical protein AAF603_10190, partial [Pseudomonadota bacterium]